MYFVGVRLGAVPLLPFERRRKCGIHANVPLSQKRGVHVTRGNAYLQVIHVSCPPPHTKTMRKLNRVVLEITQQLE